MLITSILLPAALGALTWTFAEYALHNWVGHGRRGRGEFSRHVKFFLTKIRPKCFGKV